MERLRWAGHVDLNAWFQNKLRRSSLANYDGEYTTEDSHRTLTWLLDPWILEGSKLCISSTYFLLLSRLQLIVNVVVFLLLFAGSDCLVICFEVCDGRPLLLPVRLTMKKKINVCRQAISFSFAETSFLCRVVLQRERVQFLDLFSSFPKYLLTSLSQII